MTARTHHRPAPRPARWLARLALVAGAVLAAGLITAPPAQAQSAQQTDAQITRFLMAIDMPRSIRDSLAAQLQAAGLEPSADGRAVLMMPASTMAAAIAPLLREHMSHDEARALADFYTTETGQEILAQQRVNGPDIRSVVLNPRQHAEYTNFMATSGGQAGQRWLALKDTEAFNTQLNAALQAAARAQRR